MATGALTKEVLDKFMSDFESDAKNSLVQNIVSKSNPLDACLKRKTLELNSHVFTHKVEEVKPVTNQKSSGRCWIFACLNALRIPFAKAKNLEDFEFSQNHLFFWDKVERSNYFLHAVAECYRRTPKEDPGGRLVAFLLGNPTCDGGQWDMVVNLIQKHGVMPRKCFPEAWSSEQSMRMNALLNSKLREFARDIHKRIDAGDDDAANVEDLIRQQMNTIFRVVGICLGTPPETFTWEYMDKSKKYARVADVTPVEFYEQHVKAHFDLEAKVCLVTDPRSSNPTGRTYTVDCLGNVVGGKPTIYNNQPVNTLIDIAAKSIADGEGVWFGCEHVKHQASKQGILDLDAHDHELVFGTKFNLNLSKAERLIYGDSCMSHAMVLTGATIVETDGCENGDAESAAGKPTKWRVENSWGEDSNLEKGYLSMTTAWFREFVFEIVVDKRYVAQEVLDVFKQEPTVLPAWDPMGALARN